MLGVFAEFETNLRKERTQSAKCGACETTTDVGRLMMTIMGGVAEFERGLIRKRCEEGIERAKCKGTKFGRPSALDPGQRRRITLREACPPSGRNST